ncbi:N-acetyl-1-D-myo-inositol-2-amino-2-deoxy-alpha-D-glucopyranoside deacetylase [Actinoplanes sp. M2I2]|uniref:N-acetyl-1-D-myo-inositol-2-amino-2-deoxy-alpha- D-glucopyranoside deacetylase n=1 Tax=Actinoplanes sp. M2I2 TaxID=1734444 RepID=UPI002021B59F|nr:N-acetyl-1-D-myo-inositol-2-amino-2-deoxy-alpha-D-glucopyranoside deacetylase [Actinoplanes sp. M2I2]
MTSDRSIMLVHAHPDDETTGSGVTMARYVAEGARVTLVTCTLGEEGEIHVPALAQLAADQADQLGGWRLGEWERACAHLGVTDRRFLGGAGRYRDSGMMGLESNNKPRAFWQADLEEAARLCLEVMREVRPQVLVTYDENGLYGHPDHIQAHRVAMRAAELAAEEGFGPAKIYWTAMADSQVEQLLKRFRELPDNPFAEFETAEEFPFSRPDTEIDAQIDGEAYVELKSAAFREYASQIPADSPFMLAASREWTALEHFVLAKGERGPDAGAQRWEDDLFGGVAPR